MTVITAAMNGKIPAALLAQVPGQANGLMLAIDASVSFGRLSDSIYANYGWRPALSTAYRTIAQQNALVDQGLTAVPGGKSEHGLGRAVDIKDLGGFGGLRYAQFKAEAGRHGWYQPSWATTWRPEPWHWEYDPNRDTKPTNPIEEDDLPYQPNELAQIVVDALKSDIGQAAIVSALKSDSGQAALELAIRKQFAPTGEAHKRLTSALPQATWEHKINDGALGTAQQVLRDSRIIPRRLEAAWRKFVGLPADPNQES